MMVVKTILQILWNWQRNMEFDCLTDRLVVDYWDFMLFKVDLIT